MLSTILDERMDEKKNLCICKYIENNPSVCAYLFYVFVFVFVHFLLFIFMCVVIWNTVKYYRRVDIRIKYLCVTSPFTLNEEMIELPTKRGFL